MSKSLGNIFPIREILQHYHPEVLRLFMLQSHYRSPVDYSDESLAEARAGLLRCYRTLQLMKELQGKLTADTQPVVGKRSEHQDDYLTRFRELSDKFDEAMDDDFNTAQALGHVFEMVRLTNNFIAEEKTYPLPIKLKSSPRPERFLIILERFWASSTAMPISFSHFTGKPNCARGG